MRELQRRKKLCVLIQHVSQGTWMWQGTNDEILLEVVHQVTNIPMTQLMDFYFTLNGNKPINPAKTLRESNVQDRMEI